MNGYAGKILRLDLTNRKASTIPTSDYEQWGGGVLVHRTSGISFLPAKPRIQSDLCYPPTSPLKHIRRQNF